MAFDVINSRNAVSDSESDGLRFSHIQSIIRTGGRKKYGAGIEVFWRQMFDDPGAFSPDLWQLFLRSNLTALGGKCRALCVGMTCGRLLAAGTMQQWRPQLEEINREAMKFGVGV